MTTADRNRLRKLADAATPGPWENTRNGVQQSLAAATKVGDYKYEGVGIVPEEYVRQDDAEFIAAAREAVPALLDALTRAEAQSAIRGRAVVIYRERARQAEAERDCRRRENAELRDELVATQEYGAKLAHGKDEAEARIKAVQALHTGTRWPSAICDACDQPRPCPTIRALDGDT